MVLVGKSALPFKFGISQAFRLCLVIFQVCKRCFAMLCDSCVIQESLCDVLAYFESVML